MESLQLKKITFKDQITSTELNLQGMSTRPQTAKNSSMPATSRSSLPNSPHRRTIGQTKQLILQSEPYTYGDINLNQEQQENRLKYPSVTSLTPRSQQRLKDIDTQNYKKNYSDLNYYQEQQQELQQQQQQVLSHSTIGQTKQDNQDYACLRVRGDMSEYQSKPNYKEESQFTDKEYENFKKQYQKIVFDKQGNMLYTKAEPQSRRDYLELMRMTGSVKINSSTLRRVLAEKSKLDSQHMIKNMVKSASELAQLNPRKRAIQEVKEKSLRTMQEMLQKKQASQFMAEAKIELNKVTLEMNNEVDKLLRENEVLRNDNQRMKDVIVDLKNTTEKQNIKNSIMNNDKIAMQEMLDEEKKKSQELQLFVPQYLILMNKFPEFKNSEQLISKFEHLEKVCLQLQNKISELEQQLVTEDQDKHILKGQYQQKYDKLKEKDQERDRHQLLKISQLKQKEDELKVQGQYKDIYFLLNNKVTSMFAAWQSKIKVYALSKIDEGPVADIKDPIDMLNMMDKMIQISTPEKMQEYLRKIIVSANMLQRKYLPEHVNEKFDPDKIYERILKLVNKLNSENFKLSVENRELRRKVGVHPNMTSKTSNDGVEQEAQQNLEDEEFFK